MDTIICPKCGTANLPTAMNCRNCRIDLQFALEHPDQLPGATGMPGQNEAALQPLSQDKDWAAKELKPIHTTLKWVARGLSILFSGLLLLFFIGEGFDPAEVTVREWLGLLFFPLGLVVGMAVGWWREGLGAAIAIGSVAAFYVVETVVGGDPPGGPYILLCASPGFLFGASWLLGRQSHAPR